MIDSTAFRIGTRGSPLAIAQTRLVRAGLTALHGGLAIEEFLIKTTGDRIQDRPLADIGGKGLFTKEIDEALLEGRIDCAVHSAKDVPTWLPDGLTMPSYLPREDPRDALICGIASSLAELPAGSVVGTASLRRQAQILSRRSDLKVVPFRGNVGTRLKKLNDGDVDATLLAVAGLNRLNQLKSNMHILEIDEVLPAAGQGAVGIMCREDDYKTQEILAPLNDAKTSLCVAAERAMLDVLEGTCHTPIGALATLNGETLFLQGLIAKPDGSDLIENDHTGSADGPEQLGRELGQVLLEQAGADFMAAIRQGSE